MLSQDSRDQSAMCEVCGEKPRRKAALGPLPKVSVIIGTFDCELYVEESVRSVMNQTEKNIEIIVVDDGSADGTVSILKKLESEDSRIEVHAQPHTGYPGCTRNHGLSRAKAQYVAFLDGDDLYHPQKIQRTLSAFEACPEADVVIHDLLHFEQALSETNSVSYLTKLRFLELAKNWLKEAMEGIYLCDKDLYRFMSLRFVPFCTDSIAIRKDVLCSEPVWFREDLLMGEDGELWLRLAKRRRFAFLNQVLSYYRHRAGSVTGDQVLALLKTIEISKENLERGKDIFSATDVRLYKAKIADLFFHLGYEHFRKFNLREARRAFKESLRLDFQMRPLLAYLKTFVPVSVIREYRQLAG